MTTAPKAQGFTAGENLHRSLSPVSQGMSHKMAVQYLPQHSAIFLGSVSGAGQNKAAAPGMKEGRHTVLHAAASKSRILQGGSRLGTAMRYERSRSRVSRSCSQKHVEASRT